MGPNKTTVGVTLVAGALGIGAAIWANAGEDWVLRKRSGSPETAHASLPQAKIEEKAETNAPVILQASTPVKADNLEFQVVSSTIWPMPDPTEKGPPEIPAGVSPVQFQLRVTNHGQQEVRFLSIVGNPVLQSADGKEYPMRWLGCNSTCVPKVVSLEAGKTVTVTCFPKLQSCDKSSSLRLTWNDEFNGFNAIDGLTPGKYLLKLQYNSAWRAEAWCPFAKESEPWLGDVWTAAVPVEIVDLKASKPVLANVVAAMALADATWQVPAAGKQAQVCLGFRVLSWHVRIIPSLSMVHITSADGAEFPSRKTGATVPVAAPQLLDLEPRISQSIARPATLFHAGKTLTLAWADGAGNVWHVDNLRPGRYSVRYALRTEKGEPNRWVGDIQTEAVMIDIKE